MTTVLYEVEWCSSMPTLPDGSADVDSAVYEVRDFEHENEARMYAHKIASKDVYGVARLRSFVTDEIGLKEYLSDAEEIEAVFAPFPGTRRIPAKSK